MELQAEHLNQCGGEKGLSCAIQTAQALNKPSLVHRSQMIDCDLSGAPPKLAGNTKHKFTLTCRQRSHDDGQQGLIHFSGRDNNARASFLHFGSNCGVEPNKVNIKLLAYHVHSFSSHSESRGALSHSRSSSVSWLPCFATAALMDSAQPARGRSAPAGLMITWLFETLISTLSLRPASSITDLGNRTPRELPIRTSLAGSPRAAGLKRPAFLERGLVFMISILFARSAPDKAASTAAA